jgi:hypothetical protein
MLRTRLALANVVAILPALPTYPPSTDGASSASYVRASFVTYSASDPAGPVSDSLQHPWEGIICAETVV